MRDSRLQAAPLSINDVLQPLKKLRTQASDVKAGLDELFIAKRMRNTTVRMASRLLEAGLKAGLNELIIVKCMQNT